MKLPKLNDVGNMKVTTVRSFQDLYDNVFVPARDRRAWFYVLQGETHTPYDLSTSMASPARLASTLLQISNKDPLRLSIGVNGVNTYVLDIPDVDWLEQFTYGNDEFVTTVINKIGVSATGPDNWLLVARNLPCVAQWLAPKLGAAYTPPSVYSMSQVIRSSGSHARNQTLAWLSGTLLNRMLCLILADNKVVAYTDIAQHFADYSATEVQACYDLCATTVPKINAYLYRLHPHTSIGLCIDSDAPCTRLHTLQLMNNVYMAQPFTFPNIFCIQADALHMLMRGFSREGEPIHQVITALVENPSAYVSAPDVLDPQELNYLLSLLYLADKNSKRSAQWRNNLRSIVYQNVDAKYAGHAYTFFRYAAEDHDTMCRTFERTLHPRTPLLISWCTSVELFWILLMLADDMSESLDPRLLPSLRAQGDEQLIAQLVIQDIQRLRDSKPVDFGEAYTLLNRDVGETERKAMLAQLSEHGASPSLIKLVGGK